MWALYCAYRDKMPAFASFALLAMATKEEVGLLIATIGLAILIVRRSPVGLLWAGLGIGWFLLSVLWVIPQHNPAGDSPYRQRYAYFGRGMGGIVLGAVRHPAVVSQ